MSSLTAASNTAASTASSSSSSGGSGNLGKLFLATQGLSMISSLLGGFAGNSAASSEASALNAQADLALQEAQRDAEVKRREVLSAKEDQAQAYNSSGVLSTEGTPMVVMENTLRKGQEEIDAIQKRGKAISDLYRMKASQAKNSGGSNLLQSFLGGGAGLASAFIMANKLGLFKSSSSSSSTSSTPSNLGDFTPYTGDIA